MYYAEFRATINCYSLQHPEVYCISAKSYAAHLAGLCCKIEYKGRYEIHAAVQKWLDGKADIEKPEVLVYRGHLTIIHLHGETDLPTFVKEVSEWSRSVWDAYAQLQDTARNFIKSALAAKE